MFWFWSTNVHALIKSCSAVAVIPRVAFVVTVFVGGAEMTTISIGVLSALILVEALMIISHPHASIVVSRAASVVWITIIITILVVGILRLVRPIVKSSFSACGGGGAGVIVGDGHARVVSPRSVTAPVTAIVATTSVVGVVVPVIVVHISSARSP